jgi:hypothetical protein
MQLIELKNKLVIDDFLDLHFIKEKLIKLINFKIKIIKVQEGDNNFIILF